MIIIRNKIIPFKGFKCINLFGVLFVRKECGDVTKTDINHEAIHTAQMRELMYVPCISWSGCIGSSRKAMSTETYRLSVRHTTTSIITLIWLRENIIHGLTI